MAVLLPLALAWVVLKLRAAEAPLARLVAMTEVRLLAKIEARLKLEAVATPWFSAPRLVPATAAVGPTALAHQKLVAALAALVGTWRLHCFPRLVPALAPFAKRRPALLATRQSAMLAKIQPAAVEELLAPTCLSWGVALVALVGTLGQKAAATWGTQTLRAHRAAAVVRRGKT